MTSTASELVNKHYSRLARETNDTNLGGIQKVALSFGYSLDELSSIPAGSNLGVSCGNPTALAALRQGEVVVDLGCGAGFDVFLAARKVGLSGLAIGVDMSKDMLDRARMNATKASIDNVSFIESQITEIALPSNLSDCVVSNCVINLVPEDEKPLVFNEIHRILKPGGRMVVSDILGKKPIPEHLLKNMSLYVGCISGASQVEEYEKYLKDAGFHDILIVDKKKDLNVYKCNDILMDTKAEDLNKQKIAKSPCCGGITKSSTQFSETPNCTDWTSDSEFANIAAIDFNEWVGSCDIYAVKE